MIQITEYILRDERRVNRVQVLGIIMNNEYFYTLLPFLSLHIISYIPCILSFVAVCLSVCLCVAPSCCFMCHQPTDCTLPFINHPSPFSSIHSLHHVHCSTVKGFIHSFRFSFIHWHNALSKFKQVLTTWTPPRLTFSQLLPRLFFMTVAHYCS